MRTLTIAALVLAAVAAPAAAKPFGKPHTLGTTPLAFEYDSLFTADGPHGGVAFYAPAEKQVGLKVTQRLFIVRVEGNGRAHRLTSTPAHAPGRAYDGGPPYLDLAVGPHWRMLTVERRATNLYNTFDVYGVHLSPGGRRVGAQRLGRNDDSSPFFNTNARGDAITTYGAGFTIARGAGRFVHAPKALEMHDELPYLAADGSLYDWRRPAAGGRVIAHSKGGRWGKEQSIAAGPGVSFHELASSPAGDALLVYGSGDRVDSTSVVVRWSRHGHPFGSPVELGREADPFTVEAEAIPHGRFAVRWIDGHRGLHLMRASRPGGRFREAASWTAPESAAFRRLLPLADGRTVLAWSTSDPGNVKPDRLMAAVFDPHGRIGRKQTIAAARSLDGFALRRLRANRAALVWTEVHGRKKRVRIALL